MNPFFRKLPLSVKLILMGMVPFIVLIYLSSQLYSERIQRVKLLQSYQERIQQSASIYSLINSLQNERKYSLDNALKKERPNELSNQRNRTDSAIRQLISSSDSSMAQLTSFTFLNDLKKIRDLVDQGKMPAPNVMHYYTTTVFRINTLNIALPGTDVYLQPLNKDLAAQKILSEMVMNLDIIRSNIYNALYEKKYLEETLAGMIGVHDVYKTYETELLLRGSPAAVAAFKKARDSTALKPAMKYIDTLFTRFKPDSSYTAENWWKVSEEAVQQLRTIRRETRADANAGMDRILKAEKFNKNRALALLIVGLVLVVVTITFTILGISKILMELKEAAQAISMGVTGIPLLPVSKDAIGSLTKSILKIDTNNKLLISAAEKIGDGHFNVPFQPRSKDDLLGNAIVKMKENLQRFSRENEETEQQLRQMAEKYKMIFYKSPLPKWIFDSETLQFLEVNDAAVQHYGYSHDEFLKMTIKDIRPVNDLDKFFDHIKEATATNYSALTYWQHVKKNGEVIQVEITAHVIEYESRKARMVIVHDITDRRKAEEQIYELHQGLAKSEKRFRAMIENNNEIIALVDANLRTFYRSPASARITGWSNDERDAMESISIVHPGDVEKVSKIYAAVLANPGKTFPISHRYRHKDGHYIWLEGVMTNLLHDASVKGIITNFKDITERKKAEEKLVKSEKIYKTIASSIPGSFICLMDADYKYLLIEGDMLEKLGYSKEMLLGNNAGNALSPQHFKNMLQPYLKRVFRGEIFSVETSREEYDIITRFVPLKDENNNVYAAMTVTIDITELKKAERYINELNIGLEQKVAERTSQLETVNKELEAFTYSVSHDLRAPLRIIDGFADILMNDYAKTLDKEGHRVLGVIMNNAQRMGKLIDDLLNLSHLGRKELTVTVVDMNQLVQTVIDEQQFFNKKPVQINKADLLPCNCDPQLMRQVWVNLISNAIKYSSKVEQPSINIESYIKGDEIVYSIQDNGAGFNMEYADKLFGVFQRLHKANEFEGTGVGLALVERIIIKHGGKVWAEATVNQGATFFFSLQTNIKNQ
ncbi:MAG: PAS domain S-box protein [Ferruginibacter sp.]